MGSINLSAKTTGVLGVIFGIVIFIFPIFIEKNKLILENPEIFLVKYCIIISFTSGGFYFLIIGILTYFGHLVPYYSYGVTKKDRAKIHVVTSILSLPFMIPISAVVFDETNNTNLKFLWIIMILLFVSYFVSGIRVLKRGT